MHILYIYEDDIADTLPQRHTKALLSSDYCRVSSASIRRGASLREDIPSLTITCTIKASHREGLAAVFIFYPRVENLQTCIT